MAVAVWGVVGMSAFRMRSWVMLTLRSLLTSAGWLITPTPHILYAALPSVGWPTCLHGVARKLPLKRRICQL